MNKLNMNQIGKAMYSGIIPIGKENAFNVPIGDSLTLQTYLDTRLRDINIILSNTGSESITLDYYFAYISHANSQGSVRRQSNVNETLLQNENVVLMTELDPTQGTTHVATINSKITYKNDTYEVSGMLMYEIAVNFTLKYWINKLD